MVMNIGKTILCWTYVHIDAASNWSSELRQLVATAEELAGVSRPAQYNVVKYSTAHHAISLLNYGDFFEEGFPKLREGWHVDLRSGRVVHRSYLESLNPPILHRKEELLPPAHPQVGAFRALTASAEAVGLFDDTSRIGFSRQWDQLIATRGYKVEGNVLLPLGNCEVAEAEAGDADHDPNGGVGVQRHLTALFRTGFSAPIQCLLRAGLLNSDRSLFDYGCGRGSDVRGLVEAGLTASGWDPHFAPDLPMVAADIVNLGFVINVVENYDERVEALQRAFNLAGRLLVVSVMLQTHGSDRWAAFRDGVLTSRSTFQKYYSPTELHAFISQHLHEDAIYVAPGVAFVFKDKDLEQLFVLGRRRFPRSRPIRRTTSKGHRPANRDQETVEAHRTLLGLLWQQCLQLGRLPDPTEVSDLSSILSAFRSLNRALRLAEQQYGKAALEEASAARREDLLVSIALELFKRRKPYRVLEPSIQRDIKVLFGSYTKAQEAAKSLLLEMADPENIDRACRAAASNGLGWLLDSESLQLQSSLAIRLPALLRVFIGSAAVLYGDVSTADLVKVHIRSGKVTFIRGQDFEIAYLPRIVQRIKVDLRRQDFFCYQYHDLQQAPYVYLKSRYMNEETTGYAEQAAFDERLDGLNLFNFTEYGPNAKEFERTLAEHRWEVDQHGLRRSNLAPSLDERCGRYFRYRDLVECGDTQRRTRDSNQPRNPDSYSALLDLALNVLDPVIDYFGMIKLTYGFCSSSLAKNIPGQIAPRLDQHSAHEIGRSGKPICDRLGAAADFLVEDEDMLGVARWIAANIRYDRMYLYGAHRPIHVSYGPDQSRQVVVMVKSSRSTRLLPRVIQVEDLGSLCAADFELVRPSRN